LQTKAGGVMICGSKISSDQSDSRADCSRALQPYDIALQRNEDNGRPHRAAMSDC